MNNPLLSRIVRRANNVRTVVVGNRKNVVRSRVVRSNYFSTTTIIDNHHHHHPYYYNNNNNNNNHSNASSHRPGGVVVVGSSMNQKFWFTTDDKGKDDKGKKSNKNDDTTTIIMKNDTKNSNKNNDKKSTKANNNNKQKNKNKKKNSKKKKENFAETVLEPAARGEVPSNRRGIPKLAGRKSHSHQPLKQKGKRNHNDPNDLQQAATATTSNNNNSSSSSSSSSKSNNKTTNLLRSGRKLKDVVRQYRQQQQQQQEGNSNNNDKHLQQQQQQLLALSQLFEDNQDGTDPWDVDPLEALENLPQTTKQIDKETGKEIYLISYTDQDFYDDVPSPTDTTTLNESTSSDSSSDSDSDSEEEEEDGSLLYNEEGRNIRFEIGQNLRKRDMETGELLPGNPEEEFFLKDILDYKDPFPTTPNKLANRIMPLKETGHEVDDFMTAIYEHPTKYASITSINITSPYRRPNLTPATNKDKNVQYPPDDFIQHKEYKAYMYLTNLPNHNTHFDIQDTLANNQVAEYVSNLLKVPITNVHTAHKHGAFVRFSTPQQAATTLLKTTTQRRQCHNNNNKDKQLLEMITSSSNKDSTAPVVQISNVPTHLLSDPSHLHLKQAFDIFLPNDVDITTQTITTEEGKKDDGDDDDDSNSNTVVELQFSSLSKEELNKVLTSNEFRREWEQIRNYHSKVSVFSCHCKRVLGGFTGPGKSQMYYKKDTQLEIDYGCFPSHVNGRLSQRSISLVPEFYNSHAVVWHIGSLPLTATKTQLTQWLQPHCTQTRDTNGSIHMITDADGQFQGSAYVGFDTLRDAETAIQYLTDSDTAENNVMTVNWCDTQRKLSVVVLEDIIEGGKWRKPTVGPRSERTEEELWQALDEQNMVDQYLTEEDLEFLKTHDIDINVIRDAFMSARHGNVSYSMEDDGIVGERYSDDQSQGDGFKEFCKLYMETLKEVAATPEDPGLTYKSMFMADEPQDIDTIREDFEREHNRIQKIHKKHYPSK